jgi:hypothetical protein
MPKVRALMCLASCGGLGGCAARAGMQNAQTSRRPMADHRVERRLRFVTHPIGKTAFPP